MDEKELLRIIEKESIKMEKSIDFKTKKMNGQFYTSFNMTNYMVDKLFERIKIEKRDIRKALIFEPCVGFGNFIFSFLFKLKKQFKLPKSDYKTILNNIYVNDIDKTALEKYRYYFAITVKILFDIKITDSYFSTHIGNGLLFNLNDKKPHYISLEEVFPGFSNKFDIIITNPPYKILKNDSKHGIIANNYDSISKQVKKKFTLSSEGVINLYKLFIEEFIINYSSKNALIYLLVPETLLNDKTCYKLRKYIFDNCGVISIVKIKENSQIVSAQQSMISILIEKNAKCKTINYVKDFDGDEKKTILKLNDILENDYSVSDINVSSLLMKFSNLKSYPFIHNCRGELDLTINKKYITKQKSKYPLLRGRNIDYYNIKPGNEYVHSSFVKNCSKKKYIDHQRIACQQISNIHSERRLKFALVDGNYVLGNSCNFISVDDNEYGITIYTLLGVLNSSIINDFFKAISSNNHVNNYELDKIPLPLDSLEIKKFDILVMKYLKTKNDRLLRQIDTYVVKAFEVNKK